MSKNILVVAAHADDEILGCGGTMAKHADAGDDVAVIFLTNGVGSRGAGEEDSQNVELRDCSAQKALGIVGARSLTRLELPDNAMDSVSRLEIIQALEPYIKSFQPETIYTHHGGDLNIDHRRVLEAVLTACRPQPGSFLSQIYSFEVASSTAWQGSSLSSAFSPNHYIDISQQLDRKLTALEAYSEEMRDFPHARSIKALEVQAKFRGAQVGLEAAEAFVLERSIG
ncbi:PIG-L deacetylase family protein [Rubritalea marina]|uniref:PIG-L deacetylase family protein n=1 Tax=Rubritalea marina TaxID=361055 RepID=UPI0003824167|nr:PIG-L deacetylase family protein [Rubritalea marina]